MELQAEQGDLRKVMREVELQAEQEDQQKVMREVELQAEQGDQRKVMREVELQAWQGDLRKVMRGVEQQVRPVVLELQAKMEEELMVTQVGVHQANLEVARVEHQGEVE